jgi:wee1-like protein kinase
MAKPSKEKAGKLSRYQADFTELGVIGKGHFGKVFECLHNLDRSKYAVKQIRVQKQHPYAIVQGLAEARTLASIEDTRYVVRYYSAWLEKDCLYIVMELCECPLSAYVDRQAVTEELLYRVLHDSGRGLRLMHQQGKVHLDVKPDNILLSRSGRFKLGDFGLSRVLLGNSSEVAEGDARYVAPELLEEITPSKLDLTKADIFSLGATALELLRNSRLPNNGPEWHLIRSKDLVMPACSAELSGLIVAMLSREPEERPSAEEVLARVGCRGGHKRRKQE